MSRPFYQNSAIPAEEIEAAADAMRSLADSQAANERGGVSWFYLAQVALEASARVRGRLVHEAPEVAQ